MLETRIEQDIKTALLSGDSVRLNALRFIKSTLLNAKVATGKRDSGLSDDEVLPILRREAKKRQESADLYLQGGDQARADKELDEKKIIEEYLPAQLSDDDIKKVVDEIIAANNKDDAPNLGQVIGQVKSKLGDAADGSAIARIVKGQIG